MQLDPEARTVCEAITARDGSNLYFVSQLFREAERYEAFIAMYAVMRVIDDLVDAVPDKASLPTGGRDALKRDLHEWERRIRSAYDGTPGSAAIDRALSTAVAAFPVPLRHWLDFLDAMRFDVDTPRFGDFSGFLRYCTGATVAPTAIFVFLICAEANAAGVYRCEHVDFASAGHELGIFAYIAHILRDVVPDLAVGHDGLIYLSDEDLSAHGLDEKDLRQFADQQCGDARWHGLVGVLCARADQYRQRGQAMVQSACVRLPSDRALVFHLIVDVYALLLARIQADPDVVLRPSPVISSADRAALVLATARAVRFPLAQLPSASPAKQVGERWSSSVLAAALGALAVLAMTVRLYEQVQTLIVITALGAAAGLMIRAGYVRWRMQRG